MLRIGPRTMTGVALTRPEIAPKLPVNIPKAMGFAFDDFDFDPVSGVLSVAQRSVRLRPRTAAFLDYLVRNKGRVVGKDELLAGVWPDAVVTEDSLVQCVKEIRQALGDARRDFIRTVPRSGYAFVGDAIVGGTLPGGAKAVPLHTEAHHPPSVAEAPSGAQWPRHRLIGFGMALVLVLAALGAIITHFGAWPRFGVSSAAARLSIVVLPFRSLSDDRELDWFADGITEELTTHVGRLPNSFVLASATARAYRNVSRDLRTLGRELDVRFVVEGSVRRADDQVTLHVRLADTTTGAQIWAERFDVDRARIDVAQRDVTTRIARTLHLSLAESGVARNHDGHAHDLALQGLMLINLQTMDANRRALELLAKATRADPTLTTAWGGLAKAHLQAVNQRWALDVESALDLAQDAASRAYALDPRYVGINTALAVVRIHRGQFEEALALLQAEMAANPHHSLAYDYLALVQIALGRPREALVAIETSLRLSPRDPARSGQLRLLARARLYDGNVAGAVEAAESAVAQPRPHRLAYLTLAGALMLAGREQPARAAMQEFLRRQPGYTYQRLLADELSTRPAYQAMLRPFRQAVLRAGLPEH